MVGSVQVGKLREMSQSRGWSKEWCKKKVILNDSYIAALINYRLVVNGLKEWTRSSDT